MTYKYKVDYTTEFKKDYKKIKKQNKNIEKLKTIIEQLASGNKLEEKYKDHKLNDNKRLNQIGYLYTESIIIN